MYEANKNVGSLPLLKRNVQDSWGTNKGIETGDLEDIRPLRLLEWTLTTRSKRTTTRTRHPLFSVVTARREEVESWDLAQDQNSRLTRREDDFSPVSLKQTLHFPWNSRPPGHITVTNYRDTSRRPMFPPSSLPQRRRGIVESDTLTNIGTVNRKISPTRRTPELQYGPVEEGKVRLETVE